MTHFDNQYDEEMELPKPARFEWYNYRIQEMEEKAENMGLSFDGPFYYGQEEAYVRSISDRLRHLLEDPCFHVLGRKKILCDVCDEKFDDNELTIGEDGFAICPQCLEFENADYYDLADEAAAQR